jgi:hypothetical protein
MVSTDLCKNSPRLNIHPHTFLDRSADQLGVVLQQLFDMEHQAWIFRLYEYRQSGAMAGREETNSRICKESQFHRATEPSNVNHLCASPSDPSKPVDDHD